MTDYELEAQILLDSIRKDKTRSVNNKSKKKNSKSNRSSTRSRSRSRDKKKEDTQSELNDIIQNDIQNDIKTDSAVDNTKDQGIPSRIGAPPSMQHNPILLERRKSASPSLSVSPARTLSTCPESSTEDDSISSSSSRISKSYSRSNTNSSNSSSSSSDSEIDYNTSYRITGLSESDTTRSTYDSKITPVSNTTPDSKARSFGISTLLSDGTPVSNSRTARLLRGEQMKSIRQEMMNRQSSSSYISGQSKVSSGNKKVDESWRSASGYNMSECGGLDGTIHPKASSRRNGRSNKSPLISSMTSEGGSGLKSIHTPTPCELYDRLDRSGSGSNKEGPGSGNSVSKETSSVTTGTTSGSTTESSSSSSSGRVSTSSFSSSGRHSLDKTNHSLYDSSSLDRANRSMSTLTKSLFSKPIRRYSGKHSKSTKKKHNLTKKKRVLQRSPNSSLSSSQAALTESQIFNYWESHRIGVVPGVEVSETSLLNSAKSNNKSRRNSFKDLLLRRETELDKERRKDDMIRLDGIKEEGNHHDYHQDQQYHNGEDTALVSYSAEYTLKDDKENQITKSMNRIIEDDPTMAANLNSHHQPAHTQSYIYFVLFLSSMICILSYTTPKTMSISTYSTIDKTTLSCLIISICTSFITSIVLKFDKTRRYMVKRVKLETSSMRIEFKSIVSLVSIMLLIVWTIISGILLFDVVDAEEQYRVSEDQIPNANLYFGTWSSFSIACWLFADRCVYSSDPQPRNQVRRTTQQNDISKGWILNFFYSILLVAFCESTRNSSHACNGSDLLEESTSLLCEQLRLGVVFGSLGIALILFYCGVRTLRSYRILQSIDMYTIEEMTKQWNRRVDLASFGLSILNILIFALNVEYLTSKSSARLGSEIGNIYICSWICFGVSVYLLLKHVDIIKNLEQSSIELPQQQRARVSNEPDKTSYAGGSSSRIPLIHKMINCRYGGSKAMSAFTDEDSYEYDEESGGWTTSQTSSSYSDNRSEDSEISTITPSNMNISPAFRQPNSTEEYNGHGEPTYYYEEDGNLTIDFHGQSPTRCTPRTNLEYEHQQPIQQYVPMRPDPTSSSLESQDVYQILKQKGTKSPKRQSKSIPRSYPISKSKPTPPSSQSSSSQTSASSSSKSIHGSIDANFVNSIRSASWRRAESMQFEENELYQPVTDSNNNGPFRRESLVSDPEVNLLINTLKSERGVFEASDKAVDGSDQDDGSSSNVSTLPHHNEDTDSIEDTPNTQTVTPKLISTFSKEESKDTEPTAASTVCSTTMCSTSALDTSASTRDTGISTGPLTDTTGSSCSPITEDGSIEMFFKEREKQRKSIKKEKKKVPQQVDEDEMSDISDESNGQKLVDQLLAQAQQKRRKPKSKRGEKRVNEVLRQAEIRAYRKH